MNRLLIGSRGSDSGSWHRLVSFTILHPPDVGRKCPDVIPYRRSGRLA